MSLDLKGRLIIVSNRLPVSIKRKENGHYDFSPSSGGLVTGLSGLAKSGIEFLWYGWPGSEVPEKDTARVREELLHCHNSVPVMLDQQTAECYYNGFSNSTVWPLFHHQLDKVSFDESTANAYRKANGRFLETLAHDLKDGDLIWVHDYHLMLLPLLLRQRAEKSQIQIRIGWFLHTPFPSEDFFTVLPSKNEILDGILGADVVGFHTDEDRRHFSNTCTEILGLRFADRTIELDGRQILTGTFPIGIEPSEFHSRVKKDSVQDLMRSMRAKFGDATVIVGVDRLDYIKGVPQKLHAFSMFLERHPEWVGEAVLVQVAIPSRADLEVNQRLRVDVQNLVGEINGKYGKVSFVPVHFLYKSIVPDELTALYAVADICFISSTRDGMNLVCYEYIACHNEQAKLSSHEPITEGAVVLSKFTGAAKILDGCLIVNPWDSTECSEALAHAVSMKNTSEASERMRKLGEKVEEQTSLKWGVSFLRKLNVEQEEVVDKELLDI